LILEKFPNHVFFLSTLVLRTNKENKQSALGIIKRFLYDLGLFFFLFLEATCNEVVLWISNQVARW